MYKNIGQMNKTRYTVYVTLAPIQSPASNFITNVSITPQKIPDSVISINDMFKGICDKDNNFKADCDAKREVMNDLMVSEQITKGGYGKIYLGYRGSKKYIVKHTTFYQSVYDNVKGVRFSREICCQHLASQHNVSPKILTYWKCENKNEGIIVMEYIAGLTLYEYIKTNNARVIEVYLNVLKKILYQSLVLNISHGDLHYGNIIVTNNDTFVIDYGKSRILTINVEEHIINKILPYVGDWINYTDNTINYLYYTNKHKMDNSKFIKSGLNEGSTWDDMLLSLYEKLGRVPTYLEVYEEVKNLLL